MEWSTQTSQWEKIWLSLVRGFSNRSSKQHCESNQMLKSKINPGMMGGQFSKPASSALCDGITTSRFSMEFAWQPPQFSVRLITSTACSALIGEKECRNVVFFRSLTYLLIRKTVGFRQLYN